MSDAKAGYSRIDLAKLPAPQVVEELDFETIFQRKLAKFKRITLSIHPLLSLILFIKFLRKQPMTK